MHKGPKHKKSDLNKIKDKHFNMYMSWKKVLCPALNADVQFTRFGWNHLCVTKWRTGIEQEKRLELLPLAKKLIGITTTIQGQRIKNGFLTYEFNAIIGGIKITAIVEKTKEGYIFLSDFRD